ncbi:BrxA/BrxB family bacilliredoxin [Paracrocinitomix mangrovi]|uniref:BrxA/BrxB family bacilliredoxin n=1 Tax=Paracrocinitomix mangrovi TaxID=2862509 RepID=UPI001C8D4E7F|nr:BrxA/BrxB family bacilliredoxin [Paracrocinitomix mangrovi]UKN03669.1 BrxA/BrxB family bacilliredoxin [Paracrocinitomix mangrovi]
MYPTELTTPMKQELEAAGFDSLETVDQVDSALNKEGTTLVVINSVCGCAAGTMRPGVILSTKHTKLPNNMVTVFAGVDKEATEQARKYTLPYPPSSPSIGLFKDGTLVHFIERHHIEGRSAEMIADNLKMAYDEYC